MAMKKYPLMIIFCCFFWLQTHAQGNKSDCYDADSQWDWTNLNAENWKAMTDNSGLHNISVPFKDDNDIFRSTKN